MIYVLCFPNEVLNGNKVALKTFGKETYGYYEQQYPLMNDAGLAFGESTCSARILQNQDDNFTALLVDQV
jgi:hypothetical protein